MIESWVIDDDGPVPVSSEVVLQVLRARIDSGQRDEHPDEDTVPIGEAFRLVEHIVGTGSWPADASWVVDR